MLSQPLLLLLLLPRESSRYSGAPWQLSFLTNLQQELVDVDTRSSMIGIPDRSASSRGRVGIESCRNAVRRKDPFAQRPNCTRDRPARRQSKAAPSSTRLLSAAASGFGSFASASSFLTTAATFPFPSALLLLLQILLLRTLLLRILLLRSLRRTLTECLVIVLRLRPTTHTALLVLLLGRLLYSVCRMLPLARR